MLKLSGLLAIVALSVALACAVLTAQAPPASQGSTLAVPVEPSGETATLTYFNRPIVVLRARILGRRPAERAALAVRTLDQLVAAGQTRPVEVRSGNGDVLIGVGKQVIVGLTAPDVDDLEGQTLQSVSDQTVARLQQALDEAAEARRPARLLRAGAFAVLGLGVGWVLLRALGRMRRRASERLSTLAQKAVTRTGLHDQHAVRATDRIDYFQRRLVSIAFVGLQFGVIYALVTFILRQFPYTRPWGESLRESLLTALGHLALDIVDAIPRLFTICAIIVITRFAIGLLEPWFDAVGRGAVKVPWMYPETAKTTRRLVTIVLWLFAAALAYPYVPGSDTEAFKGISIFVGLMVTLGSSGFVNQVMSGVMLTYSRALRLGDFVKIGEVEGTIIHIGVLSTKLKTLRSEEVTIPNAVVVSQTATDYSRFAESVRTTTSVTIGYDSPWRQVHAMLLLAAERTSGIRRDPKPRVIQSALEDAAVRYVLAFCLEHQESKHLTLSELHAHIQDVFNEYGVQIMTPRYEEDPETPKLVPKQQWFAAPARPDAGPDAEVRSRKIG
jgi:small-conductance mechanosensitive channel